MRQQELDARGHPCPRPLIMTRRALAELGGEGGSLTVLIDGAAAADNVERFLRECQLVPRRSGEPPTITLCVEVPAGLAATLGPAPTRCPLPEPAPATASAPGSPPAASSPPSPSRSEASATPAASSPVAATTASQALQDSGARAAAASQGVRGGVSASAGATGHVVALTRETMGTGSDELGTLLMKAFLNTLPEVTPLPTTVVVYNGAVRLACGDAPTVAALAVLQKRGVRILVCGTCLEFFGLRPQLKTGIVSNMYDILSVMTTASHVVAP